MKTLLICLLTVALPLSLSAQEVPDQEMLEKLFGVHENLADLDATLAEAEEKKIPQQTIDEALFLFHVRSDSEEELPKHIPRFEKSLSSYDPKNAVITQTAGEWRALVTFCRAIEAANKKDMAEFKKHITEAFWLNPGNAEIFGAPIQMMRDEEAMAKMVVDFKTNLLDSSGKQTDLTGHIKDRKAILIDFWASWCEPCMELMPTLQSKADLLAKHGITVIALNTEADPAIAAEVQKTKGMKMPWLVEPEGEPLSQLFKVDSLPRMVLINPDGRVLFNSHPMNSKLWDVLKTIAPQLEVPKE
ncbi:MAG: thiol-disulfide isomerase/thioredoxin [Verrucomicrobiales bacterium]|jgi:thiol-disulfide isomerase/thioredoxin